jgi:hypothetical protein
MVLSYHKHSPHFLLLRTGLRRGAGSICFNCGSPSFNIHVKPILSDKCFKCHGPVAAQSGLSLHSTKWLLQSWRFAGKGYAESAEQLELSTGSFRR